jgi:hypothetical protein
MNLIDLAESDFVPDLIIRRGIRRLLASRLRADATGLIYTCEAWLNNLDRNRASILDRFHQDLPTREAKRSLQRWRIFFMACAELFRYRGGDEWFDAHYFIDMMSELGKGQALDGRQESTWPVRVKCLRR